MKDISKRLIYVYHILGKIFGAIKHINLTDGENLSELKIGPEVALLNKTAELLEQSATTG